MDIVISPYKDDYLFYGSSMKLLEYMAAGKAVLFPALGQIKEVIADGYNGRLYEPGDYRTMTGKLLELIENDDLRRQLGANARLTIENRLDLGSPGRPDRPGPGTGRGRPEMSERPHGQNLPVLC